ncbi:MAG: KpsF/GutQ family sugar-phosphate isomerase [Sedimentisphaerales bacterium]|nr:KpsF/GutQ family sugar-phosphate isomerase [Sedimentisphaerales bacterium]
MKFDLEYAKEVINTEAEAVKAMKCMVAGQFSKALELLYNCKGSVIVSGIGKAGIIGQKISATLASTGTPSHFLHPAEAVHGDLGRIREGDIIIVLSYGGETDEIIRLINIVKQRDIKLISITSDEGSTLGEYSDVILCMGEQSEACPLGVAPSVSTTCMLAIGDALALTLMKAKNFSVEDYVRFHPGGSLGTKLMTVEQSMMFRPGEKLALARMSDTIEQMLEDTNEVKRHGAVMIVDEDGKLAGIITDADLRRLLTIKGAEVLKFKAGDIMTSNCKRIKSNALAAEATAIFHKYRIDELPVVDDGDKPLGLIDVQDIVMLKVVG